MVALDLGGVPGARFDHVGVQGPLHQEPGIGEVGGHLLEDPDEGLPDDLALLLGIGDPGQGAEEAVGGLHVDQVDVEVGPEGLLHLLGLAGPQQAVVDEDAGQLVADRPVHQSGGHRRIDPAGQPADDPGVADLAADRGHRLLDDRRRWSRWAGPRTPRRGTASGSPGRGGCGPPRGGTAPRTGRRSRSSMAATGESAVEAVTRNPGGAVDHRIAVAHPHRLAARGVRRTAPTGPVTGSSVLPNSAVLGAGHLAPEGVGEHLVAVTDAEHRDPQLEDRRIERVGVLGVHRRRTAGRG